MTALLECVVNLSEARQVATVDALAASVGSTLLDVHRDGEHNRSVFTLAGTAPAVEAAVRVLAAGTIARIDLESHVGAHPRLGALDVVPFVALRGWPLVDGDPAESLAARNRFVEWAATELDLPCFVYGPERSLPEVRRGAWSAFGPDAGPRLADPRTGASAVGARPILVAYNLWLAESDLVAAKAVAAEIRSPQLRTLGLQVGAGVQVSCNLISPWTVGPEAAFDAVASRVAVERAELVGLVPRAVLGAATRHRWPELDLEDSSTIEARLERAGLDGGSL